MNPEQLIIDSTGQATLDEAVSWVAAGYALAKGADEQALLRALAQLDNQTNVVRDAARRLTRQLTVSDLDTAAELFQLSDALPAAKFREALDLLAFKSPNRSLAGIKASAVISAQREEPCTIETLCAVAGLSYNDLEARSSVEIPAKPRGRWSPEQIEAAFQVIDAVVRATVEPLLPGATPTRAIELVPELSGPEGQPDWNTVERMRRGGIPYEVLLAQRTVGGTWLAHRNRTSGKVAHALAEKLCVALDGLDVPYKRSTAVGGKTSQSDFKQLTGLGKQVGVAVFGEGSALRHGIIFSVARDSGTARTNASKLRTIEQGDVPLALVLAGAGWAARNETGDLALAFGGRVYSERTIDLLAAELELAVKTEETK